MLVLERSRTADTEFKIHVRLEQNTVETVVKIYLEFVGNVAIFEWVEAHELEALHGHVHWLVEHFGAQTDGRRADLVYDAAALDDTLGTKQHKVNLLHNRAHRCVQDHCTIDADLLQIVGHILAFW